MNIMNPQDNKDFLQWCKDNNSDPKDEGAWEVFLEEEKEIESQRQSHSLEEMDENDREGWEDNIIKWGE